MKRESWIQAATLARRPLIASGHLDEVLEICSPETLAARTAHLESLRGSSRR